MKTVLALILTFCFSTVVAQTFVQINGISLHDRPGFNGWNYGVGVEQVVDGPWSVAGGWYYNSEYRGSTYAYGRYAVYQTNMWNIGIAAGAVTGYQQFAVLPMVFPEACYAWTCAIFVPQINNNGSSVIGLRLRIPVN